MDFSPHEKLQLFAVALDSIGIPPENHEDIRHFASIWNAEEEKASLKSMDGRIQNLISLVKTLAPRYGGECDTAVLEKVREEIQDLIGKADVNSTKEFSVMNGDSVH